MTKPRIAHASIDARVTSSAPGMLESRDPSIPGALLVTLASMLACAILGFVIERAAYRPLRNSPRLNSLITAIGVSFFLEYGGQYVFGPNPRVFTVLPRHPGLHVGPVSLGYVDVVTVVVSVVLMFLLQRIVFHTRMGTAMRAVSYNSTVASLMGVNIDLVISFTFVPGAMLGGLVLGLAEQIVSGYLSSSWRDAVAFGILILVLLVRPTGLLGRGEAEKV